jgi:hypothetical protein
MLREFGFNHESATNRSRYNADAAHWATAAANDHDDGDVVEVDTELWRPGPGR